MKAIANTLQIGIGTDCTGDGGRGSQSWPIVEDFLGAVHVQLQPEDAALSADDFNDDLNQLLDDAVTAEIGRGLAVTQWRQRFAGNVLVCKPAKWDDAAFDFSNEPDSDDQGD